jgi:hypothetical protein
MNIGGGNNMELTRQEIRIQFLDSILKENEISLKSVYMCMEEQENDIDNMDKIFDSDDELSIRKRLVLLKLISRNRANENMKYYKKAKNINAEFFETDMETFKALIVAALMFNTVFFVSACNWCGLIQAEVNKIKLPELNQSDVKNTSVSEWRIIVFSIRPAVLGATTDHELKYLDSYDAENIFGLYSGKFTFYENMHDQLLEARFQFKNKETGEPLDSIPCYMDIEVISNADNSSSIIHLDRPMKNKPSTIRSKAVPVNCSKGFTVKVLPKECYR